MSIKNLVFSMIILVLIVSCSEKEPVNVVINKFKSETNFDKKLELFNSYKNDYKEAQLGKQMLSSLINQLADKKDYEKAADLLEKNNSLATSQSYNIIAWEMFRNKGNLNKAMEYANKGVEAARKELENAEANKPQNMSDDEWMNIREASLGFVLDTYGNIVKESGNKTESLSAFEEAVKYTKGKYGDINQSYVSALINAGENEKAQNLIKKFMSEKAYTEEMKGLLKETYTKLGKSEKEFDSYLKSFENESKSKMIEKLKEEEKNIPAPEFTLKDLNGKDVSLSDFKGKTIIVDFWATWCGPCLQSFPVMKRAVEKYSSNPNVQFLFINTWERVENKKENAQEFITKNNYPFLVLLDDQNTVAKDFNVQGIPTKFIIDKKGNIRFESIGFDGLADEALAEISQMIEMIK